jgi:hypothetical protein
MGRRSLGGDGKDPNRSACGLLGCDATRDTGVFEKIALRGRQDGHDPP